MIKKLAYGVIGSLLIALLSNVIPGLKPMPPDSEFKNDSQSLVTNIDNNHGIGVYVNGVNNESSIDTISVTNNNYNLDAIRITSFRLKNMASAVLKKDTPVLLEFDWDYDGCSFDREELDVRYSWSYSDLANSSYGPHNSLIVTKDSEEGMHTAYIRIKTPKGSIATESYDFWILPQQK